MSKNDEFCINDEKLCIKNEELRDKSDEFCRFNVAESETEVKDKADLASRQVPTVSPLLH